MDLKTMGVIIHPELPHDPLRMQGHAGIVIQYLPAEDEVTVRFLNRNTGVYSADALLALLPNEALLDNLLAQLDELPEDTMRTALDIYRLQRSGTPVDIQEALFLANNHDGAAALALTDLQTWLDRGYGEPAGRSFGR